MSLADNLKAQLHFAKADLVVSLWEATGPLTNQAAREIERLDKLLQAKESTPNPACAAIEFSLTLGGDDGATFLHYWNEGAFDVLRKNWPEAPEDVYVSADPLLSPSSAAGSQLAQVS